MTDAEVHLIILGAIIHRRRVDIGMNQTGLADRLNINQSNISRIERGKSSPDFIQSRKIEVALRFAASELYGLVDVVFERAIGATIACLPDATRENWATEAVRVVGVDGFIDGPIAFAVSAVFVEKWPETSPDSRRQALLASVADKEAAARAVASAQPDRPDFIEIDIGNGIRKRVRT